MIKTPRVKSYLKYISDYLYFLKNPGNRHDLRVSLRNLHPILNENTNETSFDRHYIYHTAWAARRVKEINPKKHVDISSSLYFSGIVSAFIQVDAYDYRPADINLSGLNSKKADLLKLPFNTGIVESLSCMHVVEHVGLGRYGDPLDPDGDLKAIAELKRVVAPGGSLLFVVPIGFKSKIIYNAHRIYTHSQIISYFDDFTLKEFVLIPQRSEDGGLVKNPSPKLLNKQNYACGCFWFKKQ
jgi:SAM-dependent methyltransferase